MPYLMRDVEQVVAEFLADGQPYAVFIDNNLGSRPEYLRRLCRALRPLEKIWSAAVSIDVTDDPSLVHEMALAGCTGVFVGFESLADRQPGRRPQEDPPRGRLCSARRHAPRPRHPGQRQLRPGFRPGSSRCLQAARSSGSKRIGWNARRFTFSRPIPELLFFDSWSVRDGCFTRTGPVRYSPCRLSSRASDSRRACGRVCLVLRASFLPPFHLAAQARLAGLRSCPTWPCLICTNGLTGSGMCLFGINSPTPFGDHWWNKQGGGMSAGGEVFSVRELHCQTRFRKEEW